MDLPECDLSQELLRRSGQILTFLRRQITHSILENTLYQIYFSKGME